MFLVSIALIVVVIDPVQFVGRVVPSCVYTDVVLDSIINKLWCSMFHTKKAMKRLPVYMITSILNLKWHVCIVGYLLE